MAYVLLVVCFIPDAYKTNPNNSATAQRNNNSFGKPFIIIYCVSMNISNTASPSILQVVTPISFLKKVILYRVQGER